MSKFTRPHSSLGAIATLCSLLLLSACSSNDNSHTTATTVVTPPARQILTVVAFPSTEKSSPTAGETADQLRKFTTDNRSGVDPTKPLLFTSFSDGKTVRAGEIVVVDFSVVNAKLKGDGGEYRVRYFVDDDDPQWIDNGRPFGLAGWVPGKHKIRLELIGPDGWPYRNGDQNIITREINVSAQ